MLTLYQLCSLVLQSKEMLHPSGFEVYKLQDCCQAFKPVKACQSGHIHCIPNAFDTKHLKKMICIAARFGHDDVLKHLDVGFLKEKKLLNQKDILKALSVSSTLHCVDYLHSFVTKADATLTLRCGKHHLKTAIYFSLRYGWCEQYGEYLAANNRFNALLTVVESWGYTQINNEIVNLCFKNCTNFNICYKLIKLLIPFINADDYLPHASEEARHAVFCLQNV